MGREEQSRLTLRCVKPPPVIAQLGWRYHHVGIPTDVPRPNEKYLEAFGLHISGFSSSPFGIDWMRYSEDSPLHPAIKTLPHVAFEVGSREQNRQHARHAPSHRVDEQDVHGRPHSPTRASGEDQALGSTEDPERLRQVARPGWLACEPGSRIAYGLGGHVIAVFSPSILRRHSRNRHSWT